MEKEVLIEKKKGKGRPFIILLPEGKYEDGAEVLYDSLPDSHNVVLIKIQEVQVNTWLHSVQRLQELIELEGLRHFHFLAFGEASIFPEWYYLLNPKMFRNIIFVDPVSRLYPNKNGFSDYLEFSWENLVDVIEKHLPLGLPLRGGSGHFDSNAYLHRIRCPVLIVSSPEASQGQREEASAMAIKLPTAWHKEISIQDGIKALPLLVQDFLEVPARCSQKSNSSSASKSIPVDNPSKLKAP
ncbi:MAG: hypothetical protein GYA55_09205 [SAR324 cluster bacterium]|uniref:Alpha/beta hydrolase n=1 Tax=SAR324 cluster bacterium TaxID=2024889 RepID=A0A7X9ILT7_9DELT|nr:hypothetical protein [SAR324 cluster bacterium]